MRHSIKYVLIVFSFSIFLSGCLDLESTYMTVDIENSKAEVIYRNIVSNGATENEINEDFEGLLITAYERKGDGQEVTLVTSDLYEENGVLYGRKSYIVNDMETLLENYGIEKDHRGYTMRLDGEGTTYTDGNGVFIESATGRQVFWDKNSAVLEAEIRYDIDADRVTSLLPKWKKWKEWDTAGGADAASLLRKGLGELIKTDSADEVIDFCPNGGCYSFSTNFATEGAFNRLADFTYIYLFNMLDDTALKDFKATGEDLAIVERNMLDCPDSGELENAKCALRNLHRNYGIRLLSIVYEDMESKEMAVDLGAELGP